MTIDKSREYWYGDNAGDIEEYLTELVNEDPDNDDVIGKVGIVTCDNCGSDSFNAAIDIDEGAIEIECIDCAEKRLLLGSKENWEECSPVGLECPLCEDKAHNVAGGFVFRDNGDVKWIYIGTRCTGCGVLSSPADWEINFGQADENDEDPVDDIDEDMADDIDEDPVDDIDEDPADDSDEDPADDIDEDMADDIDEDPVDEIEEDPASDTV